MTIGEVREKYLSFFKDRGHHIIPSASILPVDDPTTLFIGSGMQPLLPYLLGEEHQKGKRLVNSQRSFRAEDIEEVGDNRHTTFFEMLGNWSLGDYFKQEQLELLFHFLTGDLNIDPRKLYVTVFAGDSENQIPRDMQSAEIWKKLFISKGIEAGEYDFTKSIEANEQRVNECRIFYYGAEKNWWSRSGVPKHMPAGEPGGPDSEVFYDFETPHDDNYGAKCHPNCDCGRFMEIGNSVFMQFIKQSDGSFNELPQKNVDFGGGLERITAAVNGDPDIFKVDALKTIVSKIENLSGKLYGNNEFKKSFRIIADHIRGSVFIIACGVVPSNTEQGYVLRRLIRNCVLHSDKLQMPNYSLALLVTPVAELYNSREEGIAGKLEQIANVIKEEETRFRITLKRGLREFEKLSNSNISGRDAFVLFTTHGFPFEITVDMAHERGVSVDRDGFTEEMKRHREMSRLGSDVKFKGGLSDTSLKTVAYHTATHILHRALSDVLGDHVSQKGSNITPERLRFDFTHEKKMTEDEIKKVEKLVNKKIHESLVVSYKDMTKEEARRFGAVGVFGEKYGDVVRVYEIGDGELSYSKEYCGGPHVSNTAELGVFRIIKEKAVADGVRRIKATLE